MADKHLKPEDVEPRLARFIIGRLNQVKSAAELARLVGFAGEPDNGAKIAKRIINRRTELGGFATLQQVAETQQVSPDRFTQLVTALGRGMESDTFIPEHDRPDLTIDLDKTVGEATIRDLTAILGGGAFGGVTGVGGGQLGGTVAAAPVVIKVIKDPKDAKDVRDAKALKDRLKDAKDARDVKAYKDRTKDIKDARDAKAFKDRTKDVKDARDAKALKDRTKDQPDIKRAKDAKDLKDRTKEQAKDAVDNRLKPYFDQKRIIPDNGGFPFAAYPGFDPSGATTALDPYTAYAGVDPGLAGMYATGGFPAGGSELDEFIQSLTGLGPETGGWG